MKTTCKKLKDNKVEISVSFSKDEVNKALAKKYKEIAVKYSFPGFRKGKAPRPVIDNLLGKDGVAAQATDDLVNDAYPLSIDEANIFPVGKADFDDEKLDIIKNGKDFCFKYTIEVEPKFDLDNYDEVEISMPADTATKSEIDDQLKQMTQYHYEYKAAPANAKVADDSSLGLEIKASDDKGNDIDTLTNDNFNYHMGSKFLSEAFEDELIGHKSGDELSFDIDIPEEPSVLLASLKDKAKKVNFKVKIKEIKKKVMPKIDDEWVKANMGFDSVEDFRSKIEEQINADKKQQLPVLKENKAMVALAKRLQGDVPQSVVDAKEAELLKEFFTHLQQQGVTMDQYLAQMQITADKFKEDIKKQAKDVVKQDLALDAYARDHKIEITDKDVEDEFKYAAADKWQDLYNDWKARGELHTLRRAILRMKAAKALVDNAKVNVEDDKKSAKDTSKSKTTTDKKKSSTTKKSTAQKKTTEAKKTDKK